MHIYDATLPATQSLGWSQRALLYGTSWSFDTRKGGSMIRQHFSNILLSSELVWIIASVSCSWLTGVAPSVVLRCCSPSASRFNVFCICLLSCSRACYLLNIFSFSDNSFKRSLDTVVQEISSSYGGMITRVTKTHPLFAVNLQNLPID